MLEEQAIESVHESVEQEQPAAEETTPLDTLCQDVFALKVRVTALESVAHSGHALDEQAITQIAELVLQRINATIRARFTPPMR